MYDIVKMWATFVVDDDGKAWLFEVKNLVVKELPMLEERKKKEDQAGVVDKETWSYLIKELNEYQKNNDLRSKEMIKNLYKLMDWNYETMKDEIAICSELYNDDHEADND